MKYLLLFIPLLAGCYPDCGPEYEKVATIVSSELCHPSDGNVVCRYNLDSGDYTFNFQGLKAGDKLWRYEKCGIEYPHQWRPIGH